MRRPEIEFSRACVKNVARAAAAPWPALGVVLLAAALAGCSSFGFGQSEQKAVDPNVFPADHKARVITLMQTDPYALVGAREASLSAPELKPFGTESRYVVCLRAVSPDWRKEKAIIFFGGEINQFVDATPEQCGKAAYQPFPELITLLRTLGGNKK